MSAATDDTDRRRLLTEVENLQRQTRSALQDMWFPLMLFGAITLVSAAVIALFGGPALGFYWPLAGTAGGVATAVHFHQREYVLGLEGRAAPYVATAVAILIGASGVGAIAGIQGNELVANVAPSLVVSVGYLVFAWLDRNRLVATESVVLAAAAVGLLVYGGDADTAGIVVALLYGSVFLVTGTASRLRLQQL